MSERMRSPFSIASIPQAAEFVQNLGGTGDKNPATSITLNAGSAATPGAANLPATIAAGENLFVGFACDNTVISGYACTDSLGNTYTVENFRYNNTATFGEFCWSILFRTTSVAGTLTSFTVSWTTSATAKAICAARFAGVGLPETGVTQETVIWQSTTVTPVLLTAGPSQGLAVAMGAKRDTTWFNNSAPGSTITTGYTTGGSASSNVSGQLRYAKPCTVGGVAFTNVTGRGAAAVGKSYDGYNPWP